LKTSELEDEDHRVDLAYYLKVRGLEILGFVEQRNTPAVEEHDVKNLP
jgi:hypothetical protein